MQLEEMVLSEVVELRVRHGLALGKIELLRAVAAAVQRVPVLYPDVTDALRAAREGGAL
jgi:hypothetical protein